MRRLLPILATAPWDGDNSLAVTWDDLGVPVVHRR